ncbi:MAG: AbrB/MazE/SpoVT family DNA-binding domain-containing protein [Clostridiales bacterium]|nr:AbrB/MazE/SpoVT family DNA-binding domain-containing protein [Clostridiales bacterium]
MIAQVKAWGNSQGIRLSKEVLETAGIRLNDYLNMEVTTDCIILKKTFRHQTLEERIAKAGGRLETSEEYNWGNPLGREAW